MFLRRQDFRDDVDERETRRDVFDAERRQVESVAVVAKVTTFDDDQFD